MTTPEYQLLAKRASSQPIHAANLPMVSENGASPEVQRLYARFRESFGGPQVPGILRCLAPHPPLMEHMRDIARSMLFVDGAFDRRHKEMIAAFVSSVNQCAYCTDSHAYFFRVHGGSAEALDAVLGCDPESAALTDSQRVRLRFARKVTENSQSVTPDDIALMRAAGWSDLQIAETIHVTAFASFNRVVNAFGLPSQELLKMFTEESNQ